MRRTTALTQLVTCWRARSSAGGLRRRPARKPAPPRSRSLSPSATPSVVAPTMPAEAMGTGPEAAKAMVQLFIDRLDFAGAHGDTRTFREVFTSRCDACGGVADFIDQTYSAGGRIRGTGWHPIRIEPAPPRGGAIKVDALVRVAPQDVIASRGAQPKHFPGADQVIKHFSLEVVSGNWRISKVEAAR